MSDPFKKNLRSTFLHYKYQSFWLSSEIRGSSAIIKHFYWVQQTFDLTCKCFNRTLILRVYSTLAISCVQNPHYLLCPWLKSVSWQCYQLHDCICVNGCSTIKDDRIQGLVRIWEIYQSLARTQWSSRAWVTDLTDCDTTVLAVSVSFLSDEAHKRSYGEFTSTEDGSVYVIKTIKDVNKTSFWFNTSKLIELNYIFYL